LHDRIRYKLLEDYNWQIDRLSPWQFKKYNCKPAPLKSSGFFML
jgi:hypothetical protein